MSTGPQLLADMAALYPKFHVTKSGLAGTLNVSDSCQVTVDHDVDPENWKVFDPISGDFSKVADVKGANKLTIAEFIGTWKEFQAEDEKKEEPHGEAPIVDQPKPTEAPNQTGSKTPILDLIDSYVGNDVLEIFGDTGSGKTAFVKQVASEASKAGKKVFYLDTERNLTKNDIELLKGCQYKYTPVIEEIDSIVQKLPAADVVILDSVGFPVLTTFARMSMKQKGDALLKLIAIFGSLKEWAYRNNGVVLVTNQPESEFNKGPNHILRPFGDKSQFAAKEIWETIKQDSKPGLTTSSIKAFRSRSVGRGTPISQMKITNAGVEVA